MKSLIKKFVCVLCVAMMITGVTGCGFNVSTSFKAPIGDDQSSVEYNTEYLTENFELENKTAEVIATKLDEKGFGKIKSNKKKIVNGTGSMTFSDGKKKYVINVEDGYISTVTDADGMIIMTLDDILELANGPSTDDFITDDIQTEPEEPDVTATEPEEPATPDDTITSGSGSSSDTGSYISAEAEEFLNDLDTDYNKVNWGVRYSPTGMEGIVISVAPYTENGSIMLLVAITNLYDKDVTFSADAIAKGTSGQEVGKATFYEVAIRSGNTVTRTIYCDDVPTGEIHWDKIELPTVFESSVYWESDWAIKTDKDGYYEVPYKLAGAEDMVPGSVVAVILDANGDILAVEDDYNIEEGSEASGTISFYTNDLGGTPADLAMFANPLATR